MVNNRVQTLQEALGVRGIHSSGGQRHRVGGGYAQGGSAADGEGADGVVHLIHRRAVQHLDGIRQAALIENTDRAVTPLDHRWNWHRSVFACRPVSISAPALPPGKHKAPDADAGSESGAGISSGRWLHEAASPASGLVGFQVHLAAGEAGFDLLEGVGWKDAKRRGLFRELSGWIQAELASGQPAAA